MEDWLVNCEAEELEETKTRIKSFRIEKYIIFSPNQRIPMGSSLECFIGKSLFPPALDTDDLIHLKKTKSNKAKSVRTTIKRVMKEQAITVEEVECIKKLKHTNILTLLGTEQDSSYR